MHNKWVTCELCRHWLVIHLPRRARETPHIFVSRIEAHVKNLMHARHTASKVVRESLVLPTHCK